MNVVQALKDMRRERAKDKLSVHKDMLERLEKCLQTAKASMRSQINAAKGKFKADATIGRDAALKRDRVKAEKAIGETRKYLSNKITTLRDELSGEQLS